MTHMLPCIRQVRSLLCLDLGWYIFALFLQTFALELYPSPSVCFPLPPRFPSALKINVLHFQQCCQMPIQRKELNVRFAHL